MLGTCMNCIPAHRNPHNSRCGVLQRSHPQLTNAWSCKRKSAHAIHMNQSWLFNFTALNICFYHVIQAVWVKTNPSLHVGFVVVKVLPSTFFCNMLLLLLSKFVFFLYLALTNKIATQYAAVLQARFSILRSFQMSDRQLKAQRFERVDLTIPHDSVAFRGTWIYKTFLLICSWYCYTTKKNTKDQPSSGIGSLIPSDFGKFWGSAPSLLQPFPTITAWRVSCSS